MTIRRYTADQIKKLKGTTRWDEVDKQTDEDIENQVKSDPDTSLPTEEELKEFKPVQKRGRK